MRLSKAIFAAGSFWEVQTAIEKLPGVVASLVGYTGGNLEKPTYQEVSAGNTGHAEAVEVVYDPDITSYDQLLNTFFSSHDPTSLNRQGADVGTQYRSAIFYLNNEQKQAAQSKVQLLNASHHYPKPIITEVTKATKFWTAEEHHQKYLQKPGQTCCVYKID